MKWFWTASAIALSGSAAAQTVPAPSQPDAPAEAVAEGGSTAAPGDIIVTARREAERLQDVPLTVTAFDDAAIASAGFRDLRDVAQLTPGLNFDDVAAGLFGAPIIRGLSQANLAGPRNVSTFVDGVYVSDPSAIDLGIVDLERIEIVKGPVSALYGRNAFAGALNYVSKAPTEQLSGFLDALVGDNGQRRVAGGVSTGIARGLSVRVGGVYDDFDGTFRDRVSGVKAGGWRRRGGTATIRWQPTDQTDIALRGYYSEDRLLPPPIVRLRQNCGQATPTGPARLFCGTVPNGQLLDFQASNNPALFGTDRKLYFISGTARHDFGPVELNLIVGHNDVDTRNFTDNDRSRDGELFQLRSATAPFAVLPGRTAFVDNATGQINRTRETSVELRLATKPDRWWKAEAGGFYYTQRFFSATRFGIDGRDLPPGTSLGSITLPPSPLNQLARLNGALTTPTGEPTDPALWTRSVNRTETISGFAALEVKPTDTITLRGEGRYTDETREIDLLFNLISFASTGNGVPALPPGTANQATYGYWNYRATAQWQPERDFLLYASVATGTNAGGFNAGAIGPLDFAFSPEENTTYEVGIKSQWFDRRLTFNIGGFYIDWTNAQLTSPPLTANAVVNVIRNTGTIESKGVEAELVFQVSKELTFSAGYSYADARFGDGAFDFFAPAVAACRASPACAPRVQTITGPNGLPFTGINLKGIQTPRQSPSQFNFTVNLDVPIDRDWGVFFRGDGSFDAEQTVFLAGLTRLPRRDVINIRGGARYKNLTVTAFVDNVLDNQAPSNALQNQVSLANFLPNTDAVLGRGRTAGVRARFNF